MMTLHDFLFLYYSCLQKKNYEKVKAHAKRDKNVPGNLKRDEIFETIYHRSASRQPAIVSPAHARASISLSLVKLLRVAAASDIFAKHSLSSKILLIK